jgi:serine protease Do
MTGWKTAAVATALWGATGLGPAASIGLTDGQGQDVLLPQDPGDNVEWLASAEQNFNFASGSSQIGVSIRDVDDKDATKAKGTATGVVVEEVETDSPAQKAGVKAGDIVTEFDGERVRSTRQFIRLVQETPAGRQVSLAVMRDGQRVTVNVQPREGNALRFRYFNIPTPKAPALMFKDDGFPQKIEKLIAASGRLGISIEDLSSQLADYFGTKDGVLVTSVSDNSNASKAGLKAGDVITALNGQNITSAGDLRTRTQRLEAGEEFSVGIVRDKKPMTLKGKIDQPQQRKPIVKAII